MAINERDLPKRPVGYNFTTCVRISDCEGELVRSAAGWHLTPEGLPICPKHGVPMKECSKQGDAWHSHNVEPRTTRCGARGTWGRKAGDGSGRGCWGTPPGWKRGRAISTYNRLTMDEAVRLDTYDTFVVAPLDAPAPERRRWLF